MTVAAAIRAARQRAQLSQQDLADKAGIGRATIAKWELDHTQPNLLNVWLVADALDITIDELVGRTDHVDD